MNSLLPKISDPAHYKRLFPDSTHWEKAIQFLVKKYGLTGDVQRGTLGSHIVYRVGNVWIKMMAPLFAKDMEYEIRGLRAVAGRLSVPTPAILAEGTLEDWPYVIITHVEGQAIRSVWASLPMDEKLRLSTQMAMITRELSLCHADPVISERFPWQSFISQQFLECEEQQKKKQLPEAWRLNVRKFLDTFDLGEFQTVSPVFLHADLTFDHFLVSDVGPPAVTGVIDMADCQVGHFEYELVAPCAFIFKRQKTLLQNYLQSCGFPVSEFNARFSEKLLAWCLLHRYFGLITYFKQEMSECAAGDFQALARKVFPLTEEKNNIVV